MTKFSLFLLLFTLLSYSVVAQQDATSKEAIEPFDVKHISEEDLKKYKEDSAFDYRENKVENSWWNNFKSWLYNIFLKIFNAMFGAAEGLRFLAVFLRVLPYVLLGLLLFLLIRFFLKVNSKSMFYNKSNPNLVGISEEEEIMRHKDIQQLIKDAISNGNYRLAIRYYYLLILKSMSDKEYIDWELQKTNYDYLTELTKSDLIQPFSDITRFYNYIWYGNFAIDAASYQKLESKFSNFHKAIDNNA